MKQRPAQLEQLAFRQADPLPVMEQFYTLQGEGSFSGTAAWFIRLSGCDVGCHWCDVKESWHPRPEQYHDCESLAQAAAESGTQRVVITGGEPTVYDVQPLCDALHEKELIVHMETAGVHELLGEIDWLCFSPKKFLKPLPSFYELAHELKVVIYHESDLKWAEEHAAKCADHVQLFLQPEWSRHDRITPVLVQYVQDHPQWRLSLQTHKYIDIP
ncbi:MAG: 7-carboxy-7-deazaguanine synthase QueE [Bacteroidota bacterium]